MRCIIKKFSAIALIFPLLFFSAFAFSANAIVDVLVVYTKGGADAYGGDPTTRINQMFQVTNQIYKDSGVNLEVRLAKTLMVNYTDDNAAETALNDITFAKHAAFSGVAAARDLAKADMVILYRPFKSVQASCGLAWVGGQSTNGDFSNAGLKGYMFSHVAMNSCGDFVTAHELGHNMGLKHSRKQDGSGGTFAYALGYGVVNQFTTIMAYQTEFNVDYWQGKMYKFSNPDIKCKGDLACGVDRNNLANGADARYALNITGPQIAKYYAANSSASSSSLAVSSAAKSLSSAVSSAVKSSVKPIEPAKLSLAFSSVKSSVKNTVSGNSSKSSSSKPTSVTESKTSASSSKSSVAVIRFKQVMNVAQYGGADWKNEVQRAKGLTIDQAKKIAAANPKITYFFIVKAGQLNLAASASATAKGVFKVGDAVFFSGKPWYGSATGIADAYEKY